SLLRGLTAGALAREATLFPVRDAPLYVPTRQYGLRGKGFQGESFFTAENPTFGVTFHYFLKDGLKTLKEKRHEAEKEAAKKGQPVRYPSADELRAEAEEEPPVILLTISDAEGRVVRTITGPIKAGLQRVSWDLRHPAPSLPRPRPAELEDLDVFIEPPGGPLVMPGTYRVALAKRERGVVTPLGEAQQ